MEVTCTSSKKPRVVRLPDDLVLEILARVPYRSLCQFKCVSRSWRALCSNPTVLRRCPQTLVGFFFGIMPLGRCSRYVRHFVNASGRGPPMVDPSLSFLPPGYSDAEIYDSCNGLVLCRRRDDDRRYPHVQSRCFVVCNQATDKWIELPDIEETPLLSYRLFHLGFDPAISSHFTVLTLLVKLQDQVVTGADIFSSETGAWSHRQSGWGDAGVLGWQSVFFNGTHHHKSPGSSSLLTVDKDGRAWGKIPTPHDFDFIGVSQGRLHAVKIRNGYQRDNDSIDIWVLEDYAGQQWTLKHAVTTMQMFGAHPISFGVSYFFIVHAIDPEHDGVIFLTAGKSRSLMSYDMDKKKVRFIWTLGDNNFIVRPYVPCFSDWPFDEH